LGENKEAEKTMKHFIKSCFGVLFAVFYYLAIAIPLIVIAVGEEIERK